MVRQSIHVKCYLKWFVSNFQLLPSTNSRILCLAVSKTSFLVLNYTSHSTSLPMAKRFPSDGHDILWSRCFTVILTGHRRQLACGLKGLVQGHAASKWQGGMLRPGHRSRAKDLNHPSTLHWTKKVPEASKASDGNSLFKCQTNLDLKKEKERERDSRLTEHNKLWAENLKGPLALSRWQRMWGCTLSHYRTGGLEVPSWWN